MPTNLAIAESFWKGIEKLEVSERGRVLEAIRKFMENPSHSSLKLHRMDKLPRSKGKNLWSARVNDDIRLLLYNLSGSHWVAVYAGHHDEAYEWAERHEVEVNKLTGELQIYKVIEKEQIQTVDIKPVLKGHTPDYLLSMGVPESYVQPLLLAGEEQFMELISGLPLPLQERLLELATGRLIPAPPKLRTIEELYEHPLGRQQLLFVRNLEELRQALTYPWERWMVFLHPAQREVVEHTFRGPARITGSAGTGKTVVVIHRAKVLAQRYPEDPILVTTFNRFLALRLRRALELLHGQVPENIVVENLHALATRWYRELGETKQSVDESDSTFRDLFQKHARGLDFSLSFLLSEHAMLDSYGLYTWEAYRSFPRTGRKTPLTGRQRYALFNAFQGFWEDLENKGLITFNRLFHQVREAVERGKLSRFRAVLVDEAQDFGPAEILFVRSLAREEQDGLFFALDPAQRIYRNPLSWQALGLEIRGRSYNLKVNYRSTKEILDLAESVLPREIDGEPRSVLSLLQGPVPEIHPFSTEEEALQELSKWIRWLLHQGTRPEEIAVFARIKDLATRVANYLKEQDIPASSPQDEESTGVYCNTIHGGKGMEFRAVALFGAQRGLLPLESLLRDKDPEERENLIEKERNLLYVALSRAREHLWVGHVGEISPLLASAYREHKQNST